MLRAEIVLKDCRYAHKMLESVIDEQRFRVYWAASLSLLRAVGHVLKKVDAETSPEVREAVDQAWKRWGDDRDAHALFWEFIEAERNLVLKKYEIRLSLNGATVYVESDTGDAEAEDLSSEYYVPVKEGHFASEDAREVVADAIRWWTAELSLISSRLTNR